VIEPSSAEIDADLCGGCRICNNLCAYTAISFDPVRRVSKINPALCKGCGTCIAACPSGAAQTGYYNNQQIFAEIEGLLMEVHE
jgi:heterodisulfide reductase subunit A